MRRLARSVNVLVPRHDHGIRTAQRIEPGRGGDGEAGGRHRSGGTGVQTVSRYWGSEPKTCAAIPSSSGNTPGRTRTAT